MSKTANSIRSINHDNSSAGYNYADDLVICCRNRAEEALVTMRDTSEASIRVLVVDDHEPWRRFASTTLLKQPELQVIGEVSDGLEAVQQAEELQPDLILLDIGLPRLNGIEAARRIRKVSPASKILFVSENRSADIAEEALSHRCRWLRRQIGCGW